MGTGKADFYADGEWNFYCDFCGAKNKSSDSMKTWDNFRVCKHHKEVRNPQDFVKGVRENPTAPWSRPKPVLQFLPPPQCTLQTSNAIPGWAVPGCMVPGLVNLAWMTNLPRLNGPFCTREGESALPGWATPGCMIPSYNPFEIPAADPDNGGIYD